MSLEAMTLVVGAARNESPGLLDLRGPEFLRLYLVLLAAAIVVAVVLRQWLRGPGGEIGRGQRDLSPLEAAYLAGGSKGAVDAAIAALVHGGMLGVAKANGYLKAADPLRHGINLPRGADAVERAVFRAATGSSGGAAISGIRRDARSATEGVADRLRAMGLVPAREWGLLIRVMPMLAVLAVLTLGVAKVVVGVGRGRPVGFLVVLCGAAVVAAVVMAALPAHRTRKGDRLLRGLRSINAALRTTAARSSDTLQPADLAMAFALFGPAVLAAGPTADLHRAMMPPSSGGSGCGGSSGCGSSGSCGGGGCGGGGCGGCGS